MVTQHWWGGGGGGSGVQCFLFLFFCFLISKKHTNCINELGLNPNLAKKEKTR